MPKAWKFWSWVVQVLVMSSPKFGVFSIVCSVFIKVRQRGYDYKIHIYTLTIKCRLTIISPNVGAFSIVCSVFIKVRQRAYNYKIYICA